MKLATARLRQISAALLCASTFALTLPLGLGLSAVQAQTPDSGAAVMARLLANQAKMQVGARFEDAGGDVAQGGAMDNTPAEQYQQWQAAEQATAARLGLQRNAKAAPNYIWPTRAANGYVHKDLHTITNYVDHNPAFPNQLRDFSCGTRTYDLASGSNHKGIDIALISDAWGIVDRGQAEVIAAAPGTIVLKQDGNFDQSCAFPTSGNPQPNMITVRHDDGSQARYLHMKKGSVTPKLVGERVATGEYLGRVGSSGFSSGPHLHFEVYNPAGQLQDPFAGTCNLMNAQSLWANQPPTIDTKILQLYTGSAARTRGACPAPTNEFQKNHFQSGELVFFNVGFRDLSAGLVTQYTVYRPDRSVFRQWTQTAPQFLANSTWWWSHTLEANAAPGQWSLEATSNGVTTKHAFTVGTAAPTNPLTTMWWNAAEPGWGLGVNRQGDSLFLNWYTYAADGQPLWLAALNASLQPDGSFLGDVIRVAGLPFNQIRGSNAVTAAVLGSARVTFDRVNPNGNPLRFDTTISGISQSKQLTPYAIGTPPVCTYTTTSRGSATNYNDMWWVPAEAGWGINLLHQGNSIFAAWFTYGSTGRDQWLVALDAARQADGSYSGILYRAQPGTPFSQINGAAATPGLIVVGSVRFSFSNGETASMVYTLDGITQTKQLQRFIFNPPYVQVCS